eukprot:2688790-Ditylum_brightwellii.AAC.1
MDVVDLLSLSSLAKSVSLYIAMNDMYCLRYSTWHTLWICGDGDIRKLCIGGKHQGWVCWEMAYDH